MHRPTRTLLRNGKTKSEVRRKSAAGRPLTPRQKRELAALPDDEIDTSDIPELPLSAWKNAIRGKFYRPVKQAVSMRLDADVVAWFKNHTSSGEGYQTRINRALRNYVQEQVKQVKRNRRSMRAQ